MDTEKKLSGVVSPGLKNGDDHFLGVEISESMYPTVDDAIQHLIQRSLQPYAADAKRPFTKRTAERRRRPLQKRPLRPQRQRLCPGPGPGVSEPTIYRYLNRIKKENHNVRG